MDPRGRYLAALVRQADVLLWDLGRGGEPRRCSIPDDEILGLCYNADGHRLALVGRKAVIVLDVVRATLGTSWKHAGADSQASFSPDGRLLALVQSDGAVSIRDVETGDQVTLTENPGTQATLRRRPGEKTTLAPAFSPDGRRLVFRAGRIGYGVWDALTGRKLLHLPDEGSQLRSPYLTKDERASRLAFSSGGEYLTAASRYDLTIYGRVETEEDSARRRQVWQRRQAPLREDTTRWYAAAVHLDAILRHVPSQHEPSQPDAHYRRGRARAELGQFAQAAADFEEAVRHRSKFLPARLALGYALLAQNDEAGCRRVCEELQALQDLSGNPDLLPPAYNLLVLLPGVLTPEASKAVAASMRTAELQVISSGGLASAAQSTIYGALQYRVGNWKRAADWLKAPSVSDPASSAERLLFLAMAQAQSGQPAEAKASLEKACAFIDRSSESDWASRVRCQWLRKEAEAVVRASSPAAKK
jgi:tetratricopeptide (TPR) repeat protein